MSISGISGMDPSWYASQARQQGAERTSTGFRLTDSSVDNSEISSCGDDLTSTSGQTAENLHSMTNSQMWDLAGKLGLGTSLRMYTITHPIQIGANGQIVDNATTDNQKIDFLQMLPGQIEFDQASGDSQLAAKDQAILNTLRAAADQNGNVTLPAD